MAQHICRYAPHRARLQQCHGTVSSCQHGGITWLYVSELQSTAVSRSFGVSPARTTLSEVAMHSTSSPDRYAWGSFAARKIACSNVKTCESRSLGQLERPLHIDADLRSGQVSYYDMAVRHSYERHGSMMGSAVVPSTMRCTWPWSKAIKLRKYADRTPTSCAHAAAASQRSRGKHQVTKSSNSSLGP